MSDGARRAGWVAAAAGIWLLAVSGGARLPAQETAAEAEVIAVIEGLFDAMRTADGAALRAAFHPELERIATSGTGPDGTPYVDFAPVDRFAEAVAAAEPGTLDERVGPAEIRIDDNLATVVTPYVFHHRGTLSHCGVDVFQLARTPEGWKIVGLADTRRRQGCEEWLP